MDKIYIEHTELKYIYEREIYVKNKNLSKYPIYTLYTPFVSS